MLKLLQNSNHTERKGPRKSPSTWRIRKDLHVHMTFRSETKGLLAKSQHGQPEFPPEAGGTDGEGKQTKETFFLLVSETKIPLRKPK